MCVGWRLTWPQFRGRATPLQQRSQGRQHQHCSEGRQRHSSRLLALACLCALAAPAAGSAAEGGGSRLLAGTAAPAGPPHRLLAPEGSPSPWWGSAAASRGVLEDRGYTSQGYDYVGKVSFVPTRGTGLPTLKLFGEEPVPQPRLDDVSTVMVTSAGQKYTKRLDTSVDVRRLPASLPAFSAQRRALTQTATDAVGQTSVSGDLNCQGCTSGDDRTQVTSTTTYPFSAVGRLIGSLGSSNQGIECSGTLISATHVVTAAHCVYDINASEQYVSAIDFSPAQSGSSQPYGSLEWDRVRVLSQFTNERSYTTTAMNYDFALITLKSKANSGTGFLALGVPPNNTASQTYTLTTAGYPGDKPDGTMWQATCGQITIGYAGNQGSFASIDQCQNNACANIMQHGCTSASGQSGSAMFDGSLVIRAILTGKVSTTNALDLNVGTKIDAFVYNTLAQWYNEDQAAAGSNATLGMVPSGPQAADSSGGSPRTIFGITVDWSNATFILVVVGIVVGCLVVLSAVLASVIKCCRRTHKPAPSGQLAQPGGYGHQVVYRPTPASQYPPTTGYPDSRQTTYPQWTSSLTQWRAAQQPVATV